MPLRPEIRDGLFLIVDCQNLFFSARDKYGSGARIDFKKLRERAEDHRVFAAVQALAFIPEHPDGEHPLTRVLRRLGYDWRNRSSNLESQLEPYGRQLSARGHAVTLAIASGDGHFAPLMDTVRAAGGRVELYTFEDIARSKSLTPRADMTAALGPDVLLGDFD